MTDPDPWLVLRAQNGDRDALETLLDSVQRSLHRYLRAMIDDGSAADDVLQETLVRIYRKLRWLDDPALFRRWSYRIASREAFRFLARRQHSRARDEDDSGLETLPDTLAARPDAGDLEHLLTHASPASRAVLLLHYEDDLTIDEVAAVLGIPPGTVKSRLAYGLQRLRETARRTPL